MLAALVPLLSLLTLPPIVLFEFVPLARQNVMGNLNQFVSASHTHFLHGVFVAGDAGELVASVLAGICTYIGLCCGYIGLFCGYIGLCCGYIGLFCKYIELCCGYIGLFCGYVGLCCGYIGLFCKYTGLCCGYIGLFCKYIGLCCGYIGLFCKCTGILGHWGTFRQYSCWYLQIYWAVLWVHRALLWVCRAILWVCRALLQMCRDIGTLGHLSPVFLQVYAGIWGSFVGM